MAPNLVGDILGLGDPLVLRPAHPGFDSRSRPETETGIELEID